MSVVVGQLSLQMSRFSLMILARNSSGLIGLTTRIVLAPILTYYGGTYVPNSMYSDALARAAAPHQAFRYSIT